MHRNPVRVALVLILILLAVIVPVVSSGYSELTQASSANTYHEAAQHYQSAAQRIPGAPIFMNFPVMHTITSKTM